MLFQSIASEVCLHVPLLKSLEDAWSNLYDVNQSLFEQHDGVFLLWKYITDKICHKAKQLQRSSKMYVETQASVSDIVISKWFQDLEKSMRKAEQIFVMLENGNETSENGNETAKNGNEAQYQSLSSLLKVNSS